MTDTSATVNIWLTIEAANALDGLLASGVDMPPEVAPAVRDAIERWHKARDHKVAEAADARIAALRDSNHPAPADPFAPFEKD